MPKKTKAVLNGLTCGGCLYIGYLNHCSKKDKVVKYSAEACRFFEPLKKYPKKNGYAEMKPYRPVILALSDDRARYEAGIRRRPDQSVLTVPVAVMRRLGLRAGQRVRVSISKIKEPTKWEDIPSAKEALAAAQYKN